MKKMATLVLSLAVTGWGTSAFAQGHGRPATTGLEHAEATANPHGDRGIENAESKQAAHKHHEHHTNFGKHKGEGHKKH